LLDCRPQLLLKLLAKAASLRPIQGEREIERKAGAIRIGLLE